MCSASGQKSTRRLLLAVGAQGVKKLRFSRVAPPCGAVSLISCGKAGGSGVFLEINSPFALSSAYGRNSRGTCCQTGTHRLYDIKFVHNNDSSCTKFYESQQFFSLTLAFFPKQHIMNGRLTIGLWHLIFCSKKEVALCGVRLLMFGRQTQKARLSYPRSPRSLHKRKEIPNFW